MSDEKLTDEELARLLSIVAGGTDLPWVVQGWKGAPDAQVFSGKEWVANATLEDCDAIVAAINAVPALVAELRAHRQAALSEEDVEALRWLRSYGGTSLRFMEGQSDKAMDTMSRALSVLTRLVEQEP